MGWHVGLLAAIVLAVQTPARTHTSIVGTWRLVSIVSEDPNGTLQPVWGDHPAGLIIYTSEGHVSAQLYDPRRPRLGPIAMARPLDPVQPSYQGLYTYFGTYVVDARAHTVSHHVEGAMAPDWVGSTLVRSYRFLSTNRLELRVVTDASGHVVVNGPVLVWERIG